MLDVSKLPDVRKLHPELKTKAEREYAAHMLAREGAYATIFGKSAPRGQILSPDDPDLMVNWPGGGIYQFKPTKKRPAWHYVTHGLSQPFEGDDGGGESGDEPISGFGIELVMSTAEQAEDWVPQLLLLCVKYLIFNNAAKVIVPGDRMPSSAFKQIAPKTMLTHMIASQSTEYETELLLPAGLCTLVHLTGVTADEIQKAKDEKRIDGTMLLATALRELGPGLVTDLKRKSVLSSKASEKVWKQARQDFVATAKR